MKMHLSVVIHTKNSEKTLKGALESVQWADEIIIVDMHSIDDSREIAKKYTDQIFTFKDVGYVEPARNFGISKAHGEWVFILDADEEVSKGLREFIQKVSTSQDSAHETVAYQIPRSNEIWGKGMEHTGWWPDYQLRLFRNGAVEWSKVIHEGPKVMGKIDQLPPKQQVAILHHNYQTVSQFVDRLNHYTTIQAKSTHYASHPETSIDAFTNEFVQRYFSWEGYKDGVRGLSLSLLQSMSEMIVVLKKWEESEFKAQSLTEEMSIAKIDELRQTLNYWIADWKVKNTSGITQLIWVCRRKLKV